LRLILVRHGETEGDCGLRYWGSTDIELNANGLKQAHKLKERLSSEKIDAIYCSRRSRAIRTAEVIAEAHNGTEIKECDELNEIDFGKIEGLTFEEISAKYPELTSKWLKWSHKLAFPDGEDFQQFNKRALKFIERLRKHNTDETVLVVGHGGPFRLILCHLMGIDLKHWWQFIFGLASITVIDVKQDSSVLVRLGETNHR